MWIACILILAFLLFEFLGNRGAKTITTQQGLDLLKQQGSVQVDSATINGPKQIVSLQLDNNFSSTIDGKTVNYGKDVQFYYVLSQGAQVAQAVEKATTRAGYKYNSIVPNNSVWSSLLTSLLPLVILFLLFWWAMSKLQSGAGGIMGMGGKKSNRLPNSEIPKTKFADVAGEPAAVQEVEEIKDFLKDPSKYRRLGARIPRGVLLYGPPGTGKTLWPGLSQEKQGFPSTPWRAPTLWKCL